MSTRPQTLLPSRTAYKVEAAVAEPSAMLHPLQRGRHSAAWLVVASEGCSAPPLRAHGAMRGYRPWMIQQ